MLIKTPDELKETGIRIFDAAGSPHEESEWVMETLVRSNLAGFDSHGVMRISFYVDRIKKGELKPGIPVDIEKETRTTAVLNGHQGWGQVLARKAMNIAIEKAREFSVGTVVVRNSQHSGRAGEWVTMAARENMIGLAYVNSRGGVGPMIPWDGLDRKLKPNPMAFAAPSGTDCPVLVDATMSVVSGGKIHHSALAGDKVPEGWIIDAEGNPTTNPNDFDGPPPGAMLPLGGIAGHKGYTLNIMVDLMAGALSGAGVSGQKTPTGNGIFLQAVNIADFIPVEEYIATVEELRAWVKSSRKQPGVSEILFPGEIEYRTTKKRKKEGIPVPDGVWREVVETGEQVGVKITE